MKNNILSIAAFFAFTTFAFAQEDIEQLQQQPVPVTERQVERDAKVAAEQEKPKDLKDKRTIKRSNDTNSKTTDTISKKRASKKPAKQ